MHKILLLLLIAVISVGCTNKSNASEESNASVQPQRAVVNEGTQIEKISSSKLGISFSVPQGTTLNDEVSPSGTNKVSLKFTDMQPTEVFQIQTRATQPSRQELEDLDTDNYNGTESTFGTTKATCYTRWNKYMKDQYKFKNQNIPDYHSTGYRLDCTAKLTNNTFIYIFYKNEVDDLNLYRARQTIAQEILSSL